MCQYTSLVPDGKTMTEMCFTFDAATRELSFRDNGNCWYSHKSVTLYYADSTTDESTLSVFGVSTLAADYDCFANSRINTKTYEDQFIYLKPNTEQSISFGKQNGIKLSCPTKITIDGVDLDERPDITLRKGWAVGVIQLTVSVRDPP